jgi:hypothetical protein
VLTAFNKYATQTKLNTKLNIKSVNITAKNITIIGDTSRRQNTLKFFETLRNNGLEILKPGYEKKGARDHFNTSVAPK